MGFSAYGKVTRF